MKDFRDLQVWRRSHELTLRVYEASGRFPTDERFGLTSQIRRSSASVPTNIAEGCGCSSDAEFARFAEIAVRSAMEVEYQLLLARDLKYLDDSQHNELTFAVTEIKRMLTALSRRLRENRLSAVNHHKLTAES